MMAAHQGLMSDCALQCDSQAKYKAIWQTVIMLYIWTVVSYTSFQLDIKLLCREWA